jgi:phytoene synthase
MLPLAHANPESIIKKYGTGYYRATFLFPKEIREATWTYYQFVRIADELVDAEDIHDRTTKLTQLKEEWKSAQFKSSNFLFLNQYKSIIQKYNIPSSYTTDFFNAMEQDLKILRYSTYSDLEAYMHGSAVVVGYTMSYIIGFTEPALVHAKALGEAFQMTNFLRDIHEDYVQRGRIYIPIEDMNCFGVTERHITNHILDDSWRALMQYEIHRTRELYQIGLAGIPLLHKRGRKAVYAAMLIYKEILDRIEKNNYDIFSKRIRISPIRKTMILLKVLWSKNL